MRGRKPRPIEIASGDTSAFLQQIARSQTRPWYQVRRARILLGEITHEPRAQILAFLVSIQQKPYPAAQGVRRRLATSVAHRHSVRSHAPVFKSDRDRLARQTLPRRDDLRPAAGTWTLVEKLDRQPDARVVANAASRCWRRSVAVTAQIGHSARGSGLARWRTPRWIPLARDPGPPALSVLLASGSAYVRSAAPPVRRALGAAALLAIPGPAVSSAAAT